jgi:hypothetical protein
MRTIVILVVTAAALAIPATAAPGHGGGKDTRSAPDAKALVSCPPSTCNPHGGRRARSINLCKASNCGR